MSQTITRAATLTVMLTCAVMLQGCLVGAVVGTAGAVVGGAAKVTGAVVGASVDSVTTSDEETRARRQREQRDYDRAQRRCEQRRANGQDC